MVEGEITMYSLYRVASNFLKCEEGPTAAEYAVMLALIIVVCLLALATLGSNANKTYTKVGSAIGTTGS
jgi:pilus assembly protein Flp/PilA